LSDPKSDPNSDRVTITIADHIADVRLNRPDKMNAIDPAMFEGIVAAIETLRTAPGVRVIVLSGAGRAFCAGLDMASMAAGGADAEGGLVERVVERRFGDANMVQQVAWGWRTLPMPVIAAAHGATLGGGFQIFSGADIRIAAADAHMCIMEAKWGLVPDMAGFALWRTTVRDDVLRELAYTARTFSGEHACELGFVSHLSDDPHGKAMEIAREIAGRSPSAVRGIKRLANLAAHADDAAILHAETDEQVAVIRKPNQIEAVMANFAKRAPVFED